MPSNIIDSFNSIKSEPLSMVIMFLAFLFLVAVISDANQTLTSIETVLIVIIGFAASYFIMKSGVTMAQKAVG